MEPQVAMGVVSQSTFYNMQSVNYDNKADNNTPHMAHTWPNMPFSVPHQPSTINPVYDYFSNCTVYSHQNKQESWTLMMNCDLLLWTASISTALELAYYFIHYSVLFKVAD